MARKITKKQKDFAKAYLEHGNATKAVRESYAPTTETTARSIGSENLTKPNIVDYLLKHSKDAENTVVEVMNHSKRIALSGNDHNHASVALRAADSLLDRVHGKATQRTELQQTSIVGYYDLSGTSSEPTHVDVEGGESPSVEPAATT